MALTGFKSSKISETTELQETDTTSPNHQSKPPNKHEIYGCPKSTFAFALVLLLAFDSHLLFPITLLK